MRGLTERVTIGMLGLALITTPLTGCLGNGGDAADTDATDAPATPGTDAAETPGKKAPTGNPDSTTWKTLGDALSAAEDRMAYGYDASHYVGVVIAGGRTVYVIATMTPESYEALNGATDAQGDYATNPAVAGMPLEFVDDITDKVVPQEELESLVGRTGQELMDAGYAFSSYRMYDDTETIAAFSNGYYTYDFTFATQLPASVAEGAPDGGEALKAATITHVESNGDISDAVLDPTRVGQQDGQQGAASATGDAGGADVPDADSGYVIDNDGEVSTGE